ncbi:402_t:CDS:1, partial [Rhizophagus irregularis]
DNIDNNNIEIKEIKEENIKNRERSKERNKDRNKELKIEIAVVKIVEK